MTDNDHPDTEEGLLHTWTDSRLTPPDPAQGMRLAIAQALMQSMALAFSGNDSRFNNGRTSYEDDAEAVLCSPQMQQLKRFIHGAAQHAASVGMEKSMEKYLEAMGLDEVTIEWVLS